MENEENLNEVQKLYIEMIEERDKKLEEMTEDFNEAISESRKYYEQVPMYDWATKQKSNEYEMAEKYGNVIVSKIHECEYNGHRIPKSLIHQMHLISEGRESKPVPEWHKKRVDKKVITFPNKEKIEWDELGDNDLQPVEFSNKNYIMKKAGVYNRARKSKSLQNPSTLLDYLLQHKPWKNEKGEYKKDKHKTYTYWYLERKLIVASRSVEQMAVDLGVSESTIKRWVNALEKDGIIKKIKVGLENVYVLGKVINENDELYFYSGEAHS